MTESVCAECGRFRPIKCRGYCGACYQTLWRTGRLDLRPRHTSVSVEEWLPTVINTDGCWLWPYGTERGYGRTRLGGSDRRVYRVVWELLIGPCPEGLVPDHQCHNAAAAAGLCPGGDTCSHRRCANPADILWVPPGVNSLSSPLTVSAVNAAKVVCDAGHPFDVARSDGRRGCRRCDADRVARRRARQR